MNQASSLSKQSEPLETIAQTPEVPTKQQQLVEGFKSLFQQLNKSNIDSGLIESVYDNNLLFEDSFHRISGRQAFKSYCESVYENLKYCEFDFHQEWITDHDAMLTWTMRYAHPRLNKGNQITVQGSSHLRFEEKVFYHRDYFDGGQLLYEHVPLLGKAIQHLKNRMA